MQTNIDFKNDLPRTICWILSVLSWILFLLTGWISFFIFIGKENEIVVKFKNVWCFMDLYGYQEENQIPYFPIQAKGIFYIILFLILMVLGSASFGLYLFKSVFKKDEHIFDGMMGTFSRYHFIPLICVISLFIVGSAKKLFIKPETNGTLNDLLDNLNYNHSGFSVCLAFSLIGLASLVFIKMQTKLEKPFYIVYIIKEGFYSCLIALFVYSLFYSSIYVGVYNKYKSAYKSINNNNQEFPYQLVEMLENLPSFMNGCGIAFSIMIGLINLVIGFFLKDILIPVINILIYFGLVTYFYSVDKEDKTINDISNAEGVLEIIVIIISFASLGYTIFMKFIQKSKVKEEV